MLDARNYSSTEVLKDGGSIQIRAIRPDDKERLAEHFAALSQRSVYLRFMGMKKRLSADELQSFTELDFVDDVGLVATLLDGKSERIIGVGRYLRRPRGQRAKRAEVAFAVLDEHQGRGIGTVLLDRLARIASASGVLEFEADVLADNRQMLGVFGKSGFRVQRAVEGGVFHVAFPTGETVEHRLAEHQRERRAAAESIRGFLEPRSVALVGASGRAGTIGNALLVNLKGGGFAGPIYPVHPTAAELEGLRVYPSLRAIGSAPDLVVIAIPAAGVEAAVEECAAIGARGVVVISAGFAEVSAEGREAERRLRDLARGAGMRLVGPNCMGVLNTDPRVALDATFAPGRPALGNVGMLSQSGALGLAMLDFLPRRNLGLSTFVSVGNKADVSSNDMLAYWAADERTKVVVLYLESFGNPRKFARVAPEVARAKPIVAVKSGRSAAGTRAAASHSASLASLDVAVDALFEQAGVIRTETLESLFDVVSLLSSQPLPAGPRVGVVTNAGGPGILLADACEAHGLELPALSEATRARLRELLPPAAGLGNPIDMIASATPEQYARTIEAVAADPSIDALVVIYIPPLVTRPEEIASAIAEGAGKIPAEKPIAAVFIAGEAPPEALQRGPRGPIPTYTFPENVALALGAAHRYGKWRRRPAGDVLELDDFTVDAARAVVDRVLAGATQPIWLEAADVATLLGLAGISCAAWEEVPVDKAGAAAKRVGFPVVLKAVVPGVTHKSDFGGVILGLDSPRSIAPALRALESRVAKLGHSLERVLVQHEVRGGIEFLAGVTTDATFGPLLVFGAGGVQVELFKDAAFRLTPLSDLDASEMIDGVRVSRLLSGYRGQPPGDRPALIDVIRRIAALAEVLPQIREMDLNPLKVLEPGKGAVVVDARVRVGGIYKASTA